MKAILPLCCATFVLFSSASIALAQGAVPAVPPDGNLLGRSTTFKDAFGKSAAELILDKELRGKITDHRPKAYLVISLSPDTKIAGRSVERWIGSLWLPDPRLTAKLDSVRLKLEKPTTDWSFRNNDKSVSKALVSPAGRLIGALTFAPSGTISVAFDQDGDRIVDFTEIAFGDGRRIAFIDESLAEKLLAVWEGRQNPFCGPTPGPDAASGARTTLSPRVDEGAGDMSRLDRRGTMGVCGGAKNKGGRNYEPGMWDYSSDFMDKECERFMSEPRPHATGYTDGGNAYLTIAGVAARQVWSTALQSTAARSVVVRAYVEGWIGRGTYENFPPAQRGGAVDAVTAFLAITLTPSTAHASPCELEGADACARAASAKGGKSSSDEKDKKDKESKDAKGSAKPGSTKGPGGKKGVPVGEPDPAAAMREFCDRRAATKHAWRALKDAVHTKGKCENPAERPVGETSTPIPDSSARGGPTPSPPGDPACPSRRDDRQRPTDLMTIIGERSGDCRRNASEASRDCEPDFRRDARGRTGSIYTGIGDIIGIDSCPEQNCDPSNR